VILLDVNVLVHAFHEASPEHAAYREWLTVTVEGDEPFGLSGLVLSGFVRIATHPRVFDQAATAAEALALADTLRSQPNAVVVAPGPRHWEIFERLCMAAGAKGTMVADA
jgi:toxin-antitoxin system PIN domain toxin